MSAAARGRWRGDGVKLGQVLTNLLSNALKFTSSGAIALSVEPAPGGLALRVSDTGIGVAKEKLAYIFEKFTQADLTPPRANSAGPDSACAICVSVSLR